MKKNNNQIRTGWASWLAKLSMCVLLFEIVTGLAITFTPFYPAVQWSVLLHTFVGLITLLPIAWYYCVHWIDYRQYTISPVVLLGYLGVAALVICSLSGLVITYQGLFL